MTFLTMIQNPITNERYIVVEGYKRYTILATLTRLDEYEAAIKAGEQEVIAQAISVKLITKRIEL